MRHANDLTSCRDAWSSQSYSSWIELQGRFKLMPAQVFNNPWRRKAQLSLWLCLHRIPTNMHGSRFCILSGVSNQKRLEYCGLLWVHDGSGSDNGTNRKQLLHCDCHVHKQWTGTLWRGNGLLDRLSQIESGMPLSPKPPKIIAKKGEKNNPSYVTGDTKTLFLF